MVVDGCYLCRHGLRSMISTGRCLLVHTNTDINMSPLQIETVMPTIMKWAMKTEENWCGYRSNLHRQHTATIHIYRESRRVARCFVSTAISLLSVVKSVLSVCVCLCVCIRVCVFVCVYARVCVPLLIIARRRDWRTRVVIVWDGDVIVCCLLQCLWAPTNEKFLSAVKRKRQQRYYIVLYNYKNKNVLDKHLQRLKQKFAQCSPQCNNGWKFI